jgi:hypothetical protein
MEIAPSEKRHIILKDVQDSDLKVNLTDFYRTSTAIQ